MVRVPQEHGSDKWPMPTVVYTEIHTVEAALHLVMMMTTTLMMMATMIMMVMIMMTTTTVQLVLLFFSK